MWTQGNLPSTALTNLPLLPSPSLPFRCSAALPLATRTVPASVPSSVPVGWVQFPQPSEGLFYSPPRRAYSVLITSRNDDLGIGGFKLPCPASASKDLLPRTHTCLPTTNQSRSPVLATSYRALPSPITCSHS